MVTYNQNLYNTQWLTLQNDIEKALESLSSLQQKLEDRISGIVTQGKAPTRVSVENQSKEILHRQYLKRIIDVGLEEVGGNVRIVYGVNADNLHEVADTSLGKNILITNRADWDDVKVIKAYRSQL